MSESKNMDTGVKTFSIGGQPRELKFTAALRFRLFLNIKTNEIKDYILSDLFKINAVAMLLVGKEAVGMNVEEILSVLEETGMVDDELEEIIGWVRQRTLNFMLKEAEQMAKSLENILPHATLLNSSLTGIQD